MSTARYAFTVTDERTTAPIAGMDIYVYVQATGEPAVMTDDLGQPLTNPLVTDTFGFAYFNADENLYRADFYLDGRLRYRETNIVVGDSNVVLKGAPPVAGRAGKFLAYDAEGKPVAATGTGADDGLRTDLAATSGATLVGAGTFTSPLIADGVSTKAAIESIGTNLASTSGAGYVGLVQGGRVQAGIKYVTPEMLGAVGGGVVNDTTALQNTINEAAARGWEIVIPKGFVYRQSGLVFPDNSIVKGEGTLIQTTDRLTAGNGCVFEGITIDGDSKTGATVGIKMEDVLDCVVRGVTFRDISFSAITMSNVNGALVEGCTFTDIGDPDAVGFDPNSAGMAVYAQNSSSVAIQRNPLAELIYGTGAYFIGDGCTDFAVEDNLIQDTFFRGVISFGTGHRRVVVARNRIYRTGEINDTGSAVGCNGIYIATDGTDPAHIDVNLNIIEDVAENGIECLGAVRIFGNKIKTTGYRTLTSPSKEGIFVESGCICENNTVIASAFHGIRQFTDVAVSNIICQNNKIIAAAADGINFQADGGGASYVNVRIDDNEIMSYSGSFAVAINGTSGGSVGTSNVVKDNVAAPGAAAAIAADVREFNNSWQW